MDDAFVFELTKTATSIFLIADSYL